LGSWRKTTITDTLGRLENKGGVDQSYGFQVATFRFNCYRAKYDSRRREVVLGQKPASEIEVRVYYWEEISGEEESIRVNSDQ